MIKRIFIALLSLPTLSLAVFLVLQPIFLVVTCASCFGYENIGNNIYIQTAASQEQKTNAQRIIQNAFKRVENIIGPKENSIKIFNSISQRDYAFLGGGETALKKFGPRVLRISENGLNTKQIARELAHMDLILRLQKGKTKQTLPAWFLEGVLRLSSQGQNASHQSTNVPNLPEDIKKIRSPLIWQRVTHESEKLKEIAYLNVVEWFAKAGKDGIIELIQRMNTGEQFEAIYTELGDRP